MKSAPFASLAVGAVLMAGLCPGQDPAALSWRADLSTTEVKNLYLRRGDSATLSARLYLRGVPYAPTNAVCYYATNGLASASWWTAPCSISSNVVSVAWTPLLEKKGASIYPLVLRLDGTAYRAAAMLYMRAAPGDDPAADGFVLDFDAIAYTNAPWATPAQALEAVRDLVSTIDPAGADTLDNTHALLLELVEKLQQPPTPYPATP